MSSERLGNLKKRLFFYRYFGLILAGVGLAPIAFISSNPSPIELAIMESGYNLFIFGLLFFALFSIVGKPYRRNVIRHGAIILALIGNILLRLGLGISPLEVDLGFLALTGGLLMNIGFYIWLVLTIIDASRRNKSKRNQPV